VLLGGGPICGIQLSLRSKQVFAEAGDGILVSAVLFKATALIEDVDRVFEINEQVRENGDTFGVVAIQARLAGCTLLGFPVGGKRRRGCNKRNNNPNHGVPKELGDLASATLTHGEEP
jgi:hypothetical protein